MNFTLKVIKNGRVVQSVRTHSIRRFADSLRTINWEGGLTAAFLRVNYGKREDWQGKVTDFYNEGEYETKEDLWLAFNAFKEEG